MDERITAQRSEHKVGDVMRVVFFTVEAGCNVSRSVYSPIKGSSPGRAQGCVSDKPTPHILTSFLTRVELSPAVLNLLILDLLVVTLIRLELASVELGLLG